LASLIYSFKSFSASIPFRSNSFLTFKDTANRANPNHHVGRIRSSNLCFTGDTIVATADDRGGVTIKQLAEESNGKLKFPVFCAKEENGKWIDEIKDAIAFKTGTKKVITIRLENNDTFRCTPDHELALLDGGYVEAKDSLNKTLQKLGLDNGIKVIEIIDNDEIEDVYDLTVDDNHNFYIETSDSNSVLVHNCTEIFQNSSPNGNLVKIYTNEGGSK
jgi:ribonucleotide reductase alpha subunit